MMTTEMGKTLAAAKAEVLKCAKACRYFAEHAESFLVDEPADASAVGAAGRLCRLAAARPGARRHALELPAVAGHAVRSPCAHGRYVGLLKHASNVPQCALFMQELFERPDSPRVASRPC